MLDPNDSNALTLCVSTQRRLVRTRKPAVDVSHGRSVPTMYAAARVEGEPAGLKINAVKCPIATSH